MATIFMDPRRVVGAVDRNLFGNFAEHLGRCIYAGIYDPHSAHADEDGMRKDVIEATARLGVSVIRWPGGNFASGYHWKDGIGPKAHRPARPELAWNAIEPNTIGTDEFIMFCRKVGAEPYFVVNCGSGDMQEAQDWVEYCNGVKATYWAQQRANNGFLEPHRVQYWGLGNEVDGPWQIGHKCADDYGKTALEFAKVMKWLDPSISLVASGSSDWGRDFGVEWDYTITRYLYNHIDYVGTHLYVGNATDDYLGYMATSELVDQRIEATAAAIAAARASRRCARPIHIAMDEWNVWYRAQHDQQLEERYNLEDALVVAMCVNSFLRHADVVKMANLAQLVNVIAPMLTLGDQLLVQSIFYPLSLYAHRNAGVALDLRIDSDTFDTPEYRGVRYLDASATLDGSRLTLNLVNKHPDQAMPVRLELTGANLAGAFTGTRVIGDGAKATNTLENPAAVRTEEVTSDALLLPPMSVTVLQTAFG